MVGALALLGGALGLAVGSFVNVVAYRVPEGRDAVRERSACRACGAKVRPRDNVPLLSYVLLRGHCRDCGAAISARYPMVEAGTAIAFLGMLAVLGAVWVLPAYWWFAAVAITLVLTDLDHKRIPNRILYPATVVGAVLLAAGALADGAGAGGGWPAIGRALAGGAVYFSFLLVIALVARGGFGFGDVKLAFFLGLYLAYLGWTVLWAGIFLAFLVGGVVAIALLATRRAGRKEAIPFGPALVAGAFIAVTYGRELVDWYLGL